MRLHGIALGSLLAGCGGPPAPEAPRSSAPPPEATLSAPSQADPSPAVDGDFARACPDSDPGRPIRVVLQLDEEVDWKHPPEQAIAALEREWQRATAECGGAKVDRSGELQLSVELPEPCGAERISGKLSLWLVPLGGRSYATVHVDGRMGSFAVAARGYVDESPEPKTACVTAELQGPATSGAGPRPATPTPRPTPGEQRATSMRLQRRLFGLFFLPLLLDPSGAPH